MVILLDEVFAISGIIKVEVSADYFGITKTESHNCFIIPCFKENNGKRIIAPNTVYFQQAVFLRELNIAIGNHALRAQPTYSVVGCAVYYNVYLFK